MFSAALIVLLATALAWGNCARCTDPAPIEQPASHDCCDKDQAPKPAPMDCAGKLVDLTKATQPDDSKVPIFLADAGPVANASVPPSGGHTEASAIDIPLLDTAGSLIATPLRI